MPITIKLNLNILSDDTIDQSDAFVKFNQAMEKEIIKSGQKNTTDKQEVNGKAFEYAVLIATKEILDQNKNVNLVIEDSNFNDAKYKFNLLDRSDQTLFLESARLGVSHICELEPRIKGPTQDMVELKIQPDQQGEIGDVRDLVLIRSTQGWEIGISAKNNSLSIKSPRLSPKKDFFAKFDILSSDSYKNKIKAIFDLLSCKKGENWSDYLEKEREIYSPILYALVSEFDEIATNNPESAEKIQKYFLGKKDHYKLLRHKKETIVEAINLHGSLNMSYENIKPLQKIQKCPPPRKVIHADIQQKKGQENTMSIAFDNGLNFLLRVHNGDTKIQTTGLKLEVSVLGYPSACYKHIISNN